MGYQSTNKYTYCSSSSNYKCVFPTFIQFTLKWVGSPSSNGIEDNIFFNLTITVNIKQKHIPDSDVIMFSCRSKLGSKVLSKLKRCGYNLCHVQINHKNKFNQKQRRIHFFQYNLSFRSNNTCNVRVFAKSLRHTMTRSLVFERVYLPLNK